ncbi:A/G-specific adenine glycosylase [Methanoculleus sp. FWC-SCC1]|uniref:A/G-specific adenine glycosylase n=2 Tax=Methanoculleus frigidifontis TaxID=2584085 RepID=A0ABT8MDF7_9EURY|nr:A/G-specific adenine glycosylase [Methanoculleus sp. FWC-SCC1]
MHYRKWGRDLPWRRTADPYRIIVAEMMLQQTQVDRVVPKYNAFLERFPEADALALSPLKNVLAAWQGLGYNRRAIALQKTAQRIVDDFGGTVPADVDTLTTFPGIGRATASAVCAYAFDMPVVYVETNIRRVFIHVFFPGREGVPDAEILPLVERTLYQESPREWYNALMDYGSVLKQRTENPNRRSAAYAVQSRFAGSDRQIRGAILRSLLEQGSLDAATLAASLGEDADRVARIVAALEREGFLAVQEGRIVPAGDGPSR